MKIFKVFVVVVLLGGCVEKRNTTKTPEQSMLDLLKKNKIEKLSLVRNYSTESNNRFIFNWKEFNSDFRLLRALPVDTLNSSSDFFFIFRRYYGILSNCKEDYGTDIIVHYKQKEISIYQWTEKNKRRDGCHDPGNASNPITDYVMNEKNTIISWSRLTTLFTSQQQLYGFNNKKDSIEFIVCDNTERYVRYYTISPFSNEVLGCHIPLDTVIKCNLFVR